MINLLKKHINDKYSIINTCSYSIWWLQVHKKNQRKMKVELQFEHLAPYLPYELKIIGSNTEDAKELATLDKTSVNIVGRGYAYGAWADISDIKPLLIPLSELTQDDLDSSEYTSFYGFRTEIEHADCSYKTMLYLIERHYDVFGLIEQGLAIDKIEYEKAKQSRTVSP